MIRVLAQLGLLIYLLVCVATLLVWMPAFFTANLDHIPEASYRYAAATGIPFGLMMMTVVARQSVSPRFKLSLVNQALFAGLSLWLGLYSFHYTLQSDFFCAVHVGMCVVFMLWNWFGYRRELNALALSRLTGSAG